MRLRHSLLLSIVFISTLFITATASAQDDLSPGQIGFRLTLQGTIRDANSNPVPGARIQVQDLMTGRIIATAYSAVNGGFEVDNLKKGQYEVVAIVGLAECRSRVDLETTRDMDLRIDVGRAANNDSSGQSVSLSQMKVPSKARKMFQKAMDAFHKSRIDDAFNFVQQALGMYPDYAQALTLRGVLNLQKGDTSSAQPDLEKAVELDYGDDASFVTLAGLYSTEGKFDDAMRILERGLTLHPTSWQALLQMARAQIGKKQYEDALHTLVRADKTVPPEDTYHYLYRAQAFIGLKNYPAAIPELETFLTKESAGPNVEPARKTLEQLRAVVSQEARK
jgi:tetratricopeptide (TPR) repeat protein